MNPTQLHAEIRDTNLSYLMLAQNMINQDVAAALFRLGINAEMADLIASLTPAQLIKMAASNMLVCRLRFDENLLLNMITDHTKDRLMAQPHAAILMAGQPAEQLAL
ncbi:flagellar transcriptional regulator FlhD [Ferrovum sp.]|uniref:flagellar transcriptional regulator FlhD n=1 Tax=Ferrovum sp. TaxID=2609467 RepID=UPI00260B9894|nr:flagellar transcriptional regulator FlhD [Ferrovum sp.]